MTPRPFLTTERLELWLPRGDDIAEMTAIVMRDEVGRHLGPSSSVSDHFTRFQRNAGSWMLFGYGSFILRERGRSKVIGNCGIFHSHRGIGAPDDDTPEGGWILSDEHWGKGYASEALGAALDWFDLEHGPRRIICLIDPDNAASLKLAGRFGFIETRRTTMGGAAGVTDGEPVVVLVREP